MQDPADTRSLLPFQVERDIVSDGTATRGLGWVRNDKKRKIVSPKRRRGSMNRMERERSKRAKGGPARRISGRRVPCRAWNTRDPSRYSMDHFLVRQCEECCGQECACPKMVGEPGLPDLGHCEDGRWLGTSILPQMYMAESLRPWIGDQGQKTSGRRSGLPVSSYELAYQCRCSPHRRRR